MTEKINGKQGGKVIHVNFGGAAPIAPAAPNNSIRETVNDGEALALTRTLNKKLRSASEAVGRREEVSRVKRPIETARELKALEVAPAIKLVRIQGALIEFRGKHIKDLQTLLGQAQAILKEHQELLSQAKGGEPDTKGVKKKWITMISDLSMATLRWRMLIIPTKSILEDIEANLRESDKFRRVINANTVYEAATDNILFVASTGNLGKLPCDYGVAMIKQYLKRNQQTPNLNE